MHDKEDEGGEKEVRGGVEGGEGVRKRNNLRHCLPREAARDGSPSPGRLGAIVQAELAVRYEQRDSSSRIGSLDEMGSLLHAIVHCSTRFLSVSFSLASSLSSSL